MKVKAIPKRIRERFLDEILEAYASGVISAGKASGMLGIPRAMFYQLLAERAIPLPKKLEESLQRELKSLTR